MKMKTKSMILASMFAAITAVMGVLPAIPLPFSPVPITLQMLGVLLSGAILGSGLGFVSIVIYLLLGLVGLPIFAGGASGPGVFTGPTGGYLIAFPIAAFLMGYLVKRAESNKKLFLVYNAFAVILPIAIVYIIGTIQLALVLDFSMSKAFLVGSLPYIPLDLLKAAIALSIAYPTRRRLNKLL